MNLSVEPGLLLSIITLVAGLTIYAFIRSRHAERMQQLKMGIPIDHNNKGYLALKIGLLLLGIGMGILLALLLNRTYFQNTFELYPALIFLFGGLGLLLSFFLAKE